MSETGEARNPAGSRHMRAALILGFVLVVTGLLHSMPSIPGLDEIVARIGGGPTVVIRKFPYEYLHPLVFFLMMLILVLHQAALRRINDGTNRWIWVLDIALLIMAAMTSFTFLIEIDTVCLIDQVTGERAELIADALKKEQEFAESMGLPIPTTVDDPSCLNRLGLWLYQVVGIGIAVFLAYNVRVWGLPLVIVAILIATYTLLTVLVWYFWGTDGISKYFVTKLGGEPRMLSDGLPNVRDLLVNNSQGLLGRFLGILMSTVFPYIILGNLFGVSAGGQSLIKLSFLATRRLRGGPAHAAILSSSLFGTISGGPVVNVLSTGVLTIPMMIKSGFSRVFAGGVEAAASSGGQIMPPVMGVAAFVLAAMTNVPYRDVVVAAALPAAFYFGCLFLMVVFQSRRQGIAALGQVTDDMRLTREDLINLIMIFGPILLILFFLLTPKEAIGCGPISALFGVVQTPTATGCEADQLPWLFQLVQNSVGDASSAGWWAAALLMMLFFLDKNIRRAPGRLIEALAKAGITISTLYLMFLAVSIIDFCLSFTGLSNFLALDIVEYLRTVMAGSDSGGVLKFLALFVTMLLAILLGMGMPTVPAYLNVALLLGPLLVTLGVAVFTAHMFIFYFAVASAITPPVAIAAFAASSITKADPMRTGFAAVRVGIVMFVIPYVLAFYPELLLVPQAQLDPAGTGQSFLPGYDGTVHLGPLLWLLARLMVALYLLASVLSRFDKGRLPRWEIPARLLLAAGVMAGQPQIYGAALAGAAVLLVWHYRRTQPAPAIPAGPDRG